MKKKKFYEPPQTKVFSILLERVLLSYSGQTTGESGQLEDGAKEDDLEDGYLWD